jgi:hypothetical protein
MWREVVGDPADPAECETSGLRRLGVLNAADKQAVWMDEHAFDYEEEVILLAAWLLYLNESSQWQRSRREATTKSAVLIVEE